jgi:hypothetical protein
MHRSDRVILSLGTSINIPPEYYYVIQITEASQRGGLSFAAVRDPPFCYGRTMREAFGMYRTTALFGDGK